MLALASPALAQTTTTLDFDNPTPAGGSGSFLNGVFREVNFGTSQWRWESGFAADPTNHVYFGSASGTSRSFTFAAGPRLLLSVRVFTLTTGTLTLSDDLGQTRTQTITPGSLQLVTTGWILASTLVTVSFTAGWDLGVDDIVSQEVTTDTTPPMVAIAAPAAGAIVSGLVTVTASASDGAGVTGVRLQLDGVDLGTEIVAPPFALDWNTGSASNGAHALTAIARDAAGNQATSAPLMVTVANAPPAPGSLRYFGNGAAAPDLDRVKIRVDDPSTAHPSPPVNVGATDITIELWLRGNATENLAPLLQCGANGNWILGNIVLDRDRFNQDRNYGVSLAGGLVVFGVTGAGTGSRTICGTTSVLDGQWHHIAVQRRRSDGQMFLYVDGALQAQALGPGGDISYPYKAVPGNFCGPTGNQPCTNSDPFLVIGAEKHDVGPLNPAFSGWIDELRLSTVLRYSTNFTPPTQPFVTDANTAALYHFDEGQGDAISDVSNPQVSRSTGVRRPGGSPAGPAWSTSTPFSAANGDTTPPVVAILAPANNATVSDVVAVTANATDNIGVTGVQFLLNGAPLGAEVTVPPYTIQWDTRAVANGPRVLTATASDAATNRTTSAPVNVTVANNAAPVTSSLSPASAAVGGPAFTLTVNGSGFVAGSVVRWNGGNRTTTFVSPTVLTASIAAGDIATAGTAAVTVFNPAPGGGTSNAQTFTIAAGNPVPSTTSLNPASAGAGGPAFTLTVSGTSFVAGSVVRWNGSNRNTTFVSSTQLSAAIPASDIATAGTAAVTVFNPAPGGGTSNAQTFTVAAAPTTVTFDSPIPPGSPDGLLNGAFQGIDFGNGQWRWSNPFAADPTRSIYFASGTGTSRGFSFAPGPRVLVSFRVYTTASGTLTVTDNTGQSLTRQVTTGSLLLVTTGWTAASTSVTVTFTAGWDLGVDDITYRVP